MTSTLIMHSVGNGDGVAKVLRHAVSTAAGACYRSPDSRPAQRLKARLLDLLDPDTQSASLVSVCGNMLDEEIGKEVRERVTASLEVQFTSKVSGLVRSIMGRRLASDASYLKRVRAEFEAGVKECLRDDPALVGSGIDYNRAELSTVLTSVITSQAIGREEKISRIRQAITEGIRDIAGDAVNEKAIKFALNPDHGNPVFDLNSLIDEVSAAYESAAEHARNTVAQRLAHVIEDKLQLAVGSCFTLSEEDQQGTLGDSVFNVVKSKADALGIAYAILDAHYPTFPSFGVIRQRMLHEGEELGNNLAVRFGNAKLDIEDLFERLNTMFDSWLSSIAHQSDTRNLAKLAEELRANLKSFDEGELSSDEQREKVWYVYIATIAFSLKLQLKSGNKKSDVKFANDVFQDILASGQHITPDEFGLRVPLILTSIFGYDRSDKNQSQAVEAASTVFRDVSREETERFIRMAMETANYLSRINDPGIQPRALSIAGKMSNYADDISNTLKSKGA